MKRKKNHRKEVYVRKDAYNPAFPVAVQVSPKDIGMFQAMIVVREKLPPHCKIKKMLGAR